MADETRSDEQQQNADAGAGKGKTWTDDEVQKIIKERDAAKKKAQAKEEAEKAALEAKMIEEGKTKELLAQREAELAEAKKKASEFDQYKAQKREGLLSKLSDDDKEIAAELSLEKLEKFVEKQSQKSQQQTQETPKYKPGSPGSLPTFKNHSEFQKFMKDNDLLV